MISASRFPLTSLAVRHGNDRESGSLAISYSRKRRPKSFTSDSLRFPSWTTRGRETHSSFLTLLLFSPHDCRRKEKKRERRAWDSRSNQEEDKSEKQVRDIIRLYSFFLFIPIFIKISTVVSISSSSSHTHLLLSIFREISIFLPVWSFCSKVISWATNF